MPRKLQHCECTELLTSFMKKSGEICKHEKMADWAFTYGLDSDVYKTITTIISEDRENYNRLAGVIKENCPETHNKMVSLIRSLECGC